MRILGTFIGHNSGTGDRSAINVSPYEYSMGLVHIVTLRMWSFALPLAARSLHVEQVQTRYGSPSPVRSERR